LTPPSSPRRVHNGFVSARVPLFKKSGFVKGCCDRCKKGDPCSSRAPKTSYLCLQLYKQPINPASNASTRQNPASNASTRQNSSSPGAPTHGSRAPVPWHPASACLLTPLAPLAPFSGRLRATPFLLPARLNRLDDTHHPAHSPLARTTALPRDAYAVATYPHRAHFLYTHPTLAALPLAPRRTSL